MTLKNFSDKFLFISKVLVTNLAEYPRKIFTENRDDQNIELEVRLAQIWSRIDIAGAWRLPSLKFFHAKLSTKVLSQITSCQASLRTLARLQASKRGIRDTRVTRHSIGFSDNRRALQSLDNQLSFPWIFQYPDIITPVQSRRTYSKLTSWLT